MTAVAQLQSTSTDTPTRAQSLILMRNLLRTTMSSICYLRGLFPEDSFRDKNLTGINIKSLVPKEDNAKKLIQYMEEGVFDALEKKYLRTLVFGIGKTTEDLLEAYNFDFSYHDDEVVMDMSRAGNDKKYHTKTKEDMKKATVAMLRNLLSLSQTLQPLPEIHFLTMKILYHDERTPPDYEPKFFRSAAKEEVDFRDSPMKIRMGTVDTLYHTFSLRVQTSVDLFDGDMNANDKSDPMDTEVTAEKPEEPKKVQEKEPVAEEDDETEAPDDEDYFKTIRDDYMKTGEFSIKSILSRFPTLSYATVEEFQRRLEKEDTFKKNMQIMEFSSKHSDSPVTPSQQKATVSAQAEELWKKALKAIPGKDRITMPYIREVLGVSIKVANELLKRLEKEGILGAATVKGRPVLSNSIAKTAIVSAIGDTEPNNTEPDNTEPAETINTPKEAPLSHRRRGRPAKNDEKSSQIKRKFSEFEFSESQDPCARKKVKCSVLSNPLRQQRGTNK